MKVGILAVQGDFEAHAATLARMGADYVFVRTPRDLEGVDAVILPGGESTTQWKFLVEEGLDKSLVAHAARGGAIFGTCAGAILLAREVAHPAQASLDLMDIAVVRNAYGRQIDSRIASVTPEAEFASRTAPGDMEAVFIRAPIIRRVGDGARVLVRYRGDPVLVEQGPHMVATFHPELSSDSRVHALFLQKLG